MTFKDHRKAEDFLVIVHNPASIAYDQLVRVHLPDKLWAAEHWDGKQFATIDSDVFE